MSRVFLCLLPRAAAVARGGVLRLTEAAVPDFRFALPPADRLEAFARQAQPVLDRASRTHDEIPSLAAQRDRLLIELISGETGPGSVPDLQG